MLVNLKGGVKGQVPLQKTRLFFLTHSKCHSPEHHSDNGVHFHELLQDVFFCIGTCIGIIGLEVACSSYSHLTWSIKGLFTQAIEIIHQCNDVALVKDVHQSFGSGLTMYL